MYRILCMNQSNAIPELFREFDKETDNGKNMDDINKLLDKACGEIIRAFNKKNVQQLQYDRSALMIPNTNKKHNYNEFELVTWLIIR